MPDTVQRAVEDSQPSGAAELLREPRLGVAHEALKLLASRIDVDALDGVRRPTPAVRMVGKRNRASAREDGRASDHDPVEACRFVLRGEHRAGCPTARQARVHRAARVRLRQTRLGTHGAVDECEAVRPAADLRVVSRELPAVLNDLALEGLR